MAAQQSGRGQLWIPGDRNAFRKFVLDLAREDLAAAFPGDRGVEAAARYVSGGISELLIWSADNHAAPGAKELNEFCLKLTKPVLETLRRARG